MRKLGMLMIAAMGLVGCGSSSSGVTYPLPGASNLPMNPGDCLIINAAPQTIPAATVSYSLTDGYADDNFEVGVVLSSYGCNFTPGEILIDDSFTGSGGDSALVPAGTYDLDVVCQNLVAPCLIANITWSATY